MKITKNKKVETITEEIEVKDGIYYFSLGYRDEEPSYYFKVVIETGDWEDGFAYITEDRFEAAKERVKQKL